MTQAFSDCSDQALVEDQGRMIDPARFVVSALDPEIGPGGHHGGHVGAGGAAGIAEGADRHASGLPDLLRNRLSLKPDTAP